MDVTPVTFTFPGLSLCIPKMFVLIKLWCKIFATSGLIVWVPRICPLKIVVGDKFFPPANNVCEPRVDTFVKPWCKILTAPAFILCVGKNYWDDIDPETR